MAVGAVVGVVTAAVFAVGVLDGGQGHGQSPDERIAVEPVPPGQRATGTDAPLPARSSRAPSSSPGATTTTTTAGTTTTTTTKRADDPADPADPADPVTTTEEQQPPPPPPTNDPPTTTTTRCHSLICVG